MNFIKHEDSHMLVSEAPCTDLCSEYFNQTHCEHSIKHIQLRSFSQTSVIKKRTAHDVEHTVHL